MTVLFRLRGSGWGCSQLSVAGRASARRIWRFLKKKSQPIVFFHVTSIEQFSGDALEQVFTKNYS